MGHQYVLWRNNDPWRSHSSQICAHSQSIVWRVKRLLVVNVNSDNAPTINALCNVWSEIWWSSWARFIKHKRLVTETATTAPDTAWRPIIAHTANGILLLHIQHRPLYMTLTFIAYVLLIDSMLSVTLVTTILVRLIFQSIFKTYS